MGVLDRPLSQSQERCCGVIRWKNLGVALKIIVHFSHFYIFFMAFQLFIQHLYFILLQLFDIKQFYKQKLRKQRQELRQKGEPKFATILDGHHHPLILTLLDHSSTTDVDIMLTDHNSVTSLCNSTNPLPFAASLQKYIIHPMHIL